MKIKITNKKTGKFNVVDSDAIYSIILDCGKYNSGDYSSNAYSSKNSEEQFFEFVNNGELSVSEHLAKIKELVG